MTDQAGHDLEAQVGDGLVFRVVDGKVVQLGGGEAIRLGGSKGAWELDSLARRLIGVALWCLPKGSRRRFRGEWLAELEEMEREGIPTLGPALWILHGAPAQGRTLRAAIRRRARATAALPPALGRRTWLISVEAPAQKSIRPGDEWCRRIPCPPQARDGDVVVCQNADGLLGMTYVRVSSDRGVYPHCPYCRSRTFQNRLDRLPKYRCIDCQRVFDHPQGIALRYGSDRSIEWAVWSDLSGLLSVDDLKALRIGRRSWRGVAELHSGAFADALAATGKPQTMRYKPPAPPTGQHRENEAVS
ncbi:hypothetical protein ACWEQA_35185 [Nocardia sp. NPDC004085]